MTELRLPALAARLWTGGAPRDDLVTRVCDALRAQIAEHALPAGTRLPSEALLAKELKISRPTLREATRILARDGLLDVRHGVGTFVAAGSPHLRNALDAMSSLTATIRAAGRVAGVRNLSIEPATPPYEVAQALETPAGVRVARITRVRLVDGAPLALAAEYLPLGATLSLERLAGFAGASLYEFLRRDLGLALLLMREIHFGEGGRRVLYSVNHHNSAVIDLTLARVGARA
jgi:GntR family transcriptional regulator